MADRVSQIVVETAELGTPNARASQVVAEVSAEGTPAARASQIVAEVSAGGTPSARASQVTAEVSAFGSPKARISQIVIEFWVQNLQVTMPPIYPDLPGRTFPTIVRPKFFNLGVKTATGASIDKQLAASPLWEFDLTYSALRNGFMWREGSNEYATLLGFMLSLNGSSGRFLFPVEWDRSVTGQFVATTDGTTTVFTLNRTFGRGALSGTEPVGYVDTVQPFNVYLDGVLQDHTTYQLIQTTPAQQQLKTLSTIASGHTLTVDMSYYYYCKFQDDQYDFEEMMRDLFTLKKVTIESCRPGA